MRFITTDSPAGPLTLTSQDEKITGLYFGELTFDAESGGEILERALGQLEEYFSGKRRDFDLPLEPHGTEFRMKVWKALQDIPYGETRSYGDIAKAIGSPKGVRAVGNANHHNPIAIIIPCHRVVGFDGSLTGYGGGLEIKRMLLELEGRNI